MTLDIQSTISPPSPIEQGHITNWQLDPDIHFLNHGCFGARTNTVANAQEAWRRNYERRPIETLDRRRSSAIDNAKKIVGPRFGMTPANFGFVSNATGGVNVVLRSLSLSPDDELLTTNHVYNAVRNTMRHLVENAGGRYVEVPVPMPINSADSIVKTLAAHINDRTRLIVIDHVSSATAVVFPVEQILRIANKHGVDVLVDGAHAPGMIPLDIESLDAAYYTANLHKWVCAPSGAAILWTRPDRQSPIHPATISHFLGEGYSAEFAWQGTRDISAWCCSAVAIEQFESIGWDRILEHNHQLATWAHTMLCQRWNVEPATPLDGSLLGSMATVRLPEGARRFDTSDDLHDVLYEKYKIEVPIIDWDDTWWCRISCQMYNEPRQYELLADAMLEVCRGDGA